MIRRMRMDEFEGAHPGALLGIDYARGAKVGLPVRVMVELGERKYRPELKRWDWTGKIVKCSPALREKYLGAELFVNPSDQIAVPV